MSPERRTCVRVWSTLRIASSAAVHDDPVRRFGDAEPEAIVDERRRTFVLFRRNVRSASDRAARRQYWLS